MTQIELIFTDFLCQLNNYAKSFYLLTMKNYERVNR